MRVVEKLFVALVVLVFVLVGYVMYEHWNVRRWDAKIDALCAANGGSDVATRVYETAVAPETKEYFVEVKPVREFRVPERRQGQNLGPLFPYVLETRVLEVLNQREPSVTRFVERVVRVSDNKVLSERFAYQRAGGGVPSWDPGEIRTCPVLRVEDRLDVNTFTNHPRFVQKAQK